MEKAFAYYRYSSHNQDDGNSINAQRQAVQQFAKENKIKIIQDYIDKAKTGTNTNREGYQKMLAELSDHPEVKTILVHVLDRMHRNTREQLNMIYELKAIPHKDCASDAKSDFSLDCTKSMQAYWRMSKRFCAR